MTGVEILNQTNVYKVDGEPLLFWIAIGLGFIIGLIFMITQWAEYGFDMDGFLMLIAFTFIGAFVGCIAFACSLDDTDELNYVKYQVTISDEVSLNEFMDKYEILDQEGKIYTVKEKENNNE